VAEMATRWRPVELRYYLGSAHYRSAIEYSPGALDESAKAYARIENALRRAAELVGEIKPAVELPLGFSDAMDDDLGVPSALAVVFDWVGRVNTDIELVSRGESAARPRLELAAAQLLGMVAVLGLDPFDPRGANEAGFPWEKDYARIRPEYFDAADQRRDHGSFWWFMRNLIYTYREQPEIGWSDVEILKQPNRAVLAHVCREKSGWAMVALHNFGSDGCVVPIEIENVPPGSILVDLLGGLAEIALDAHGRVEVHLEPYGYRWLRVKRPEDEPIV